ncbi:T9SS type A sorting domain-containing protein [Flammeovirga yaeyamensis]|uniref:T9SS type A sorting domain-containing protein n=1 Tax=Flammeovirga yaeyamensis TaxID=367791 RepID=A0AAX1ND53_9BACT|nr:T9SS type A sorting domain-containing protein [Flammeovirga yaeyamensis]MBB3696655.1 hypothetical protein [Flammeovirga yaeyamensis]NMF33328.1 T9SS type A sorting domain-containing protein [Flammeovirga yaeyamensis]QWG05395.1 T9SS type A sorting domain-containing protein [Flammeovirga yaeyamensis]
MKRNITSILFFIIGHLSFAQNLIPNGDFEGDNGNWNFKGTSEIISNTYNPDHGNAVRFTMNASGGWATVGLNQNITDQFTFPLAEAQEFMVTYDLALEFDETQMTAADADKYTNDTGFSTGFFLISNASNQGNWMKSTKEAGYVNIQNVYTLGTDVNDLNVEVRIGKALDGYSDQFKLSGLSYVFDNLEMIPLADFMQAELEDLALTFNSVDPQDGNGIVFDIESFPSSHKGIYLTWASGNPSLIDDQGVIIQRPEVETKVTFVATATLQNTTTQKEVEVTLLPIIDGSGNYIVSNANFEKDLAVGWNTINAGNFQQVDYHGSKAIQLEGGGSSIGNLQVNSIGYPVYKNPSVVSYYKVTSTVESTNPADKIRYRFRYQLAGDASYTSLTGVVNTSEIGEGQHHIVNYYQLDNPEEKLLEGLGVQIQYGGSTGNIIIDYVNLEEVSEDEYQLNNLVSTFALQLQNEENLNNVRTNFPLQTTDELGYGSTITWEVKNPDAYPDAVVIEDNHAVLNRSLAKIEGVELTATISKGNVSVQKVFTFALASFSPQEQLDQAYAALEVLFEEGNAYDNVFQDVTLVTSTINNVKVEWVSNHANITETGEVTLTSEEVEGTLTATLTKTTSTDPLTVDKTFTLTTAKNDESKVQEVLDAISITYAVGDDKDNVTQNVVLPLTDDTYADAVIEWTSDNAAITNAGEVTTSYEDNITVTLTATASIGMKEQSKEFVLTVAQDEAQAVIEALKLVVIDLNGNVDADNITDNIVLSSDGAFNTSIEWTSSNENVLATDGTVNQISTDQSIKLTAVAKLNDAASESKEFDVIVLGDPSKKLEEAVMAVEVVYAEGEDANNVMSNVTLASTGLFDVNISWSSNNEAVIANDGAVVRSIEDETVTLTATVTLDDKSMDKTFDLKVIADASLQFAAAVEALEIGLADADTEDNVTSDVDLPLSSLYNTLVTWESSNEDVITVDGEVTGQAEDVNVTLTATITLGDLSTTKDFDVTVAKVEAPTSIDPNQVAITVYPNPSADQINVTANKIIQSVDVFDLLGRKMENLPTLELGNNKVQINISKLHKGKYVVLVNGKAKTFIKQ